ncbi:fimbrial chaperone protein (plasmid) [Novosphingobium pentaromativorans US6-1]|nr:fimbrial chaperone protein [Novosphingobium pentaromativorans US6-1]
MGEAKEPASMAASLIAAAIALLPLRAWAATVLIWPIDPAIEAGRAGTELWLENRGSSDVVLQVRVLSWSQEEGREVHSEQDEVLASPPMVKVVPGVRQLVRLVMAKPEPREREGAYRVIVDEIPAVTGKPAEKQTATALRFRMRYSIPLFVAPKQSGAMATQPQLSCRLNPGGRRIRLTNTGTVHARLADAVLDSANGSVPLAQGLLGYVLPGSIMEWAVPGKATSSGTLLAKVNGNAKQVALGACMPL